MSHLLGSQPKVIPEFTGLQVNTSVQVLPIPIIYGSPRVNINLIYYNGFNSQLVNQGGGGGKGILTGGKGGSQQVEYFATIIMAIGEGTLGNVQIIYQDQEVWVPSDFPTNGAFYFNGTDVQTPWDYVVSNWPADARPYKDTAYYGFSNAQLDSSATVPQIGLVLEGHLTGSSPLNHSIIYVTTGQYDQNGNPISFIGNIDLGDADADPALVIIDFLTNPTYGATFPSYWIDTTTLITSSSGYDPTTGDAALSTFCQAVGLAWSVVVDNAESANSIIDRWCKNLNVAPVWNGELLQFFPYWDAFSGLNPGWDSANGIPLKYFAPYLTPIIAIPLEQIVQDKSKDEDPITWSRKDPLEIYNTIRIDFKDRTNFFNDVAVEAKDEAHAELYGPRVDNIGLADEYTLLTYANISAQMQLRRNIGIVRNFTWKMGPLWGWLTPMTVIAIPDPANYANNITVRIISVEDDEDENVTIVAEEFPAGSQAPTAIPTSATTPPNQGATNVSPSRVYPPVIFAPTTDMLTATGFATPQVVTGFSGGYDGTLDPNWGGAFVWTSLDNITYQLLGSMNGPSTIGALSAPLAGYGGVNPDNSDTLTVNLSISNGTLGSFTDSAASMGASTCVLQDVSGFEVLSYTTATLVGPNTYALTGLYRGLYGTTPRLFGTGSKFLYVGTGSNIFETNLPAAYVGQLFYAKFQSYNIFHTSTEELSDCVAYTYMATGPTPVGPIPPPMVAATYRRLSRTDSSSTVSRRKSSASR